MFKFFTHCCHYLYSVCHLSLNTSWCSDQLVIPFNCSASRYNLSNWRFLPLQNCLKLLQTSRYPTHTLSAKHNM